MSEHTTERDAGWPCDDYKAPLTCYTVPKGPKHLTCGGCREAFPNGPEVQRLYRPVAEKAEAERDAYRKAKQENDERFQLDAATQRERAEKAEAEVERLTAMLGALGFCPKDGDSMPCLTCGAGL